MQAHVVKAVLQGHGIDCVCHGENVADLFGWGRFGTGMNLAVGPVKVLVRGEDADEAMRILREHYGENAEEVDIPESEWRGLTPPDEDT